MYNDQCRSKCTTTSAAITAKIVRSHMVRCKGLTNTVASKMTFEKFCVGDGAFQQAIKISSSL